jgi:hypothetical protein
MEVGTCLKYAVHIYGIVTLESPCTINVANKENVLRRTMLSHQAALSKLDLGENRYGGKLLFSYKGNLLGSISFNHFIKYLVSLTTNPLPLKQTVSLPMDSI